MRSYPYSEKTHERKSRRRRRPFQQWGQTSVEEGPWLGFSCRNPVGHRRANVGNPAPSPKAKNQNFKKPNTQLKKKNKERKKEKEWIRVSWDFGLCVDGRWCCLGFWVCTCLPTTSLYLLRQFKLLQHSLSVFVCFCSFWVLWEREREREREGIAEN